MPNHFQKFVFLGAVVAAALFSRIAYPTLYTGKKGGAGPAAAGAKVPLFVFPPLANVAGGDTQVSSAASGQAPRAAAGSSDGSQNAANGSGDGNVMPPQYSAAFRSTAGAGSPNFTAKGSALPPVIASRASLVADLGTESVLYGSNIDLRWPLASVTKLMTATVVLDKMDLGQRVTVTPAATDADPGQTLLQAGDVYTVSDLLRVMLLPSSNVAAEALADAYGRDGFLAEMNARAAAWGMGSTHYDDPSGLSPQNQSTASDLLRLARKIYVDYPQLLAITRTPQVTITELNSGRQVPVKSINDFAGRSDFIGGKTGYTDEADGNLLSIFRYENQPVLVIVLGTNDGVRFANTLSLYQWFTGNFK